MHFLFNLYLKNTFQIKKKSPIFRFCYTRWFLKNGFIKWYRTLQKKHFDSVLIRIFRSFHLQEKTLLRRRRIYAIQFAAIFYLLVCFWSYLLPQETLTFEILKPSFKFKYKTNPPNTHTHNPSSLSFSPWIALTNPEDPNPGKSVPASYLPPHPNPPHSHLPTTLSRRPGENPARRYPIPENPILQSAEAYGPLQRLLQSRTSSP